jgi:long-subunit acyl-CoA synthetase (AMP-forming)
MRDFPQTIIEGEILPKGQRVMIGYWKDKEKTPQTMTKV